MSEAVNFTSDIEVKDEFLSISCFTKESTEPFYKNFHAFLISKTDAIKKLKKNFEAEKARSKEHLNVVMIGIDSLSRLNHMRSMPKARDYLLNNLSAIELKGYTKVADNTFVNVVPLTTGRFLEELPWNETLSREPFDKYNFIWKNFNNNGYPTLYAEDAPNIATFNYLKFGFLKPPSLHYYRPFAKAMEDESSVWNSGHHCVHDRPETTILLDYVHNFMRKYRNQPHFSYSFNSRLTHDAMKDALRADDPYVAWLKSVHYEGLLNNTVLIFFSDHGLRFGAFRKTYVGKLEERLPMMYFVFPKWFLKKYPTISANLQINKNRLTSPFDIYATLKNILYFNGTSNAKVDPKQRGISLFNIIPESRTCENSGILPHWCVCMAQTSLPTDNPLAVKSVNFLIQVINNYLKKYPLCEPLSLKTIKSVQIMENNDKLLRFAESKNDVSVLLTPGAGEFEATVKYEETSGEFSMAGDISRINLYGHDADCVSDSKIRKICYCVK
ncbi:hypothetical protein LOTGIDRAFT_153160 [Lottia gigantea]|uniref:Sulfatase N-terminal domain-containing protein n=1 Tax=Lottia gigantea TaxID=225164 RepID=V4BX95_LOTGI|nr:hypothetical protein LOTGIDRAFT_153160 [Lottia gigantea]ESO93704.1 hypothetical protein LOTGIDRAFT_153160 [Lottia gigantea]